ncbi:MAG: uroporphyrinogen-III synthase [Chloroflexi bacterium]|nr:uroporphyrinogen-III synthase [Chloroflexota bacterium]
MTVRRPLDGLRIAITRAAEQCAELSARLRAHGAEPLEWPLIAFAPSDSAAADAEVGTPAQYHWVVFSSANGVRFFCDRPGMGTWPGRVQVAAVGPQTAAALDRRGIRVDAMPAEYRAAQIAGAIGDVRNLRILIVRPADAPRDLPVSLTNAGADVAEAIVYRTVGVAPPQTLDSLRPDAITLASGSAAASLAALLAGKPLPESTLIASIGPATTAGARRAGLPVHVEAAEHTLDGLVAALVKHYERKVSA